MDEESRPVVGVPWQEVLKPVENDLSQSSSDYSNTLKELFYLGRSKDGEPLAESLSNQSKQLDSYFSSNPESTTHAFLEAIENLVIQCPLIATTLSISHKRGVTTMALTVVDAVIRRFAEVLQSGDSLKLRMLIRFLSSCGSSGLISANSLVSQYLIILDVAHRRSPAENESLIYSVIMSLFWFANSSTSFGGSMGLLTSSLKPQLLRALSNVVDPSSNVIMSARTALKYSEAMTSEKNSSCGLLSWLDVMPSFSEELKFAFESQQVHPVLHVWNVLTTALGFPSTTLNDQASIFSRISSMSDDEINGLSWDNVAVESIPRPLNGPGVVNLLEGSPDAQRDTSSFALSPVDFDPETEQWIVPEAPLGAAEGYVVVAPVDPPAFPATCTPAAAPASHQRHWLRPQWHLLGYGGLATSEAVLRISKLPPPSPTSVAQVFALRETLHESILLLQPYAVETAIRLFVVPMGQGRGAAPALPSLPILLETLVTQAMWGSVDLNSLELDAYSSEPGLESVHFNAGNDIVDSFGGNRTNFLALVVAELFREDARASQGSEKGEKVVPALFSLLGQIVHKFAALLDPQALHAYVCFLSRFLSMNDYQWLWKEWAPKILLHSELSAWGAPDTTSVSPDMSATGIEIQKVRDRLAIHLLERTMALAGPVNHEKLHKMVEKSSLEAHMPLLPVEAPQTSFVHPSDLPRLLSYRRQAAQSGQGEALAGRKRTSDEPDSTSTGDNKEITGDSSKETNVEVFGPLAPLPEDFGSVHESSSPVFMRLFLALGPHLQQEQFCELIDHLINNEGFSQVEAFRMGWHAVLLYARASLRNLDKVLQRYAVALAPREGHMALNYTHSEPLTLLLTALHAVQEVWARCPRAASAAADTLVQVPSLHLSASDLLTAHAHALVTSPMNTRDALLRTMDAARAEAVCAGRLLRELDPAIAHGILDASSESAKLSNADFSSRLEGLRQRERLAREQYVRAAAELVQGLIKGLLRGEEIGMSEQESEETLDPRAHALLIEQGRQALALLRTVLRSHAAVIPQSLEFVELPELHPLPDHPLNLAIEMIKNYQNFPQRKVYVRPALVRDRMIPL